METGVCTKQEGACTKQERDCVYPYAMEKKDLAWTLRNNAIQVRANETQTRWNDQQLWAQRVLVGTMMSDVDSDRLQAIAKAVNRINNNKQLHQRLEFFGYKHLRLSTFRFVRHDRTYPDIELRAPMTGEDMESEWPVELLNYIYLWEVVIYKADIAKKSQNTRFLNKAAKRMREEDEMVTADTAKRLRGERELLKTDEAVEDEEAETGGWSEGDWCEPARA